MATSHIQFAYASTPIKNTATKAPAPIPVLARALRMGMSQTSTTGLYYKHVTRMTSATSAGFGEIKRTILN